MLGYSERSESTNHFETMSRYNFGQLWCILPFAEDRNAKDEYYWGDDSQDHSHQQHVDTIPGKHRDHLSGHVTAGTDKYLVIRAELRLVQFTRVLLGRCYRRYCQVISCKVLQICQLCLKCNFIKINPPILHFPYQIQIWGIWSTDINFSFVIAIIKKWLVIEDEIINLSVDNSGSSPLY